jgi:hypothetical protein
VLDIIASMYDPIGHVQLRQFIKRSAIDIMLSDKSYFTMCKGSIIANREAPDPTRGMFRV